MSIAALDHAAIPIDDVDAMLRFYADLGFGVREMQPPLFYSVVFGEHRLNFHGPKAWRSSAFTEAARYLGREGEFGTLVPGASADMVLLGANPLVDIANTRLIRGVMIRGEWWSKQMIDAEMAAIQREYAEDAARLRQLGIVAPTER